MWRDISLNVNVRKRQNEWRNPWKWTCLFENSSWAQVTSRLKAQLKNKCNFEVKKTQTLCCCFWRLWIRSPPPPHRFQSCLYIFRIEICTSGIFLLVWVRDVGRMETSTASTTQQELHCDTFPFYGAPPRRSRCGALLWINGSGSNV